MADSLLWIQTSLNDFGIGGLAVRDLIDFLKFCLANTNAAVRTNAVSTLGVVRLFAGPNIRSFVEDLNPTLLATIDAEFAKVAELEPPKPLKGAADNADDVMEELFPRVDIAPQLAKFISGMSDSNWKVRKENMDQVLALIESAKRIKPTIGDIMGALKGRLADNNKALEILALDIIKALALAMGKPFEKPFKVYSANILATLTDSKPHIRAASIACMDQITESIGFEQMIAPSAMALATDSPHLRGDLLKWLDSKLSVIEEPEKTDLAPLLSPVLSCLMDRNAEVRKGAQNMLKHLASNVGFDRLRDKCRELKGPSVPGILAMVDDLRGEVKTVEHAPVPLEKETKSVEPPSDSKMIKGKTLLKRKTNVATSSAKAVAQVAEARQPPVLTGETKPKELRAEKDRGLGKWTFETPRKEHLDLLADQMAPHFSAEVRNLLFSTSHNRDRDFLSGLTMLDEPISSEEYSEVNFGISFAEMSKRYIANSDVLLKYLTIRFFDTGTTMLIKCLDFLENLVKVMQNQEYRLMEYEASLFLPVFIGKV